MGNTQLLTISKKALEKDYINTERWFYHISSIYLRQQFQAYGTYMSIGQCALNFSLKGKPVAMLLRILARTNEQQRERVETNCTPYQISPTINKP